MWWRYICGDCRCLHVLIYHRKWADDRCVELINSNSEVWGFVLVKGFVWVSHRRGDRCVHDWEQTSFDYTWGFSDNEVRRRGRFLDGIGTLRLPPKVQTGEAISPGVNKAEVSEVSTH
ncbi:uncharacterized protein LOC135162132 [Diachasmimorpha longicaudata]|uniref:uncharacterized protein LOC135162132 n=1 Tax=Diachasmimorpha longicaudata TaxID=58733 RepID=UPI0030B891FB